MKKRMWALLLAGVLTIGQCGTVVFAADETSEQPVISAGETDEPVAYGETSVTPNKTNVDASGGSIIFTVSEKVETCIVNEGEQTLVMGTDYSVNDMSDSSGRYIIIFPENTLTSERTFTVILNGVEITITQAGKPAVESSISKVTQVSRTFLDNGRTEYVYDVEGENLQEVGVLVHKSVNSKFTASQYTVNREGTGTMQRVTVSIAPWDELNAMFDETEIKGFIRFYPTTSDMGSWNYVEQLDIQLIKDEKPAEPETPEMVVTPNNTAISADGGYVVFEVSQSVKEYSVTVDGVELVEDEDYEVNDLGGRFGIYFWENPGNTPRTLTVTLNGVATNILQEAASTSEISSVTEVSRTFLEDGRTEYVYDVEGKDLQEVGVLVHKSFNSKFNTSQYTVSREGTGTKQRVTVTIAPWDELGEPFEKEINGFIRFYPTTSDMTSFNYAVELNIKLIKA